MLKAQQAEVSSFAEYAKTLSSVKLNTEELLIEKKYIKSLYGILHKLKINNPLMSEIGKLGWADEPGNFSYTIYILLYVDLFFLILLNKCIIKH